MIPGNLYVVATRELQARLSPKWLSKAAAVYDPRDISAAAFLLGLGNFDPVVYEQHGLTLPRWALYDCAAIPGLICGYCTDATTVDPAILAALELDRSFTEPVPLTCCIAIPTLEPNHWLTYSIAGLRDALQLAGPDRRQDTLRFAIELLQRPRLTGAAQWHSTELDVASRLGPLRLRAAWSPAHSDPATVVYDLDAYAHVEGSDKIQVSIDSAKDLINLHKEILAGAIIYLAGPLARATGIATLLRGSAP